MALIPYEKTASIESRTLISRNVYWENAIDGSELAIPANYAAPYYQMEVGSIVELRSVIERVCLAFYTSDLPADAIIHNAFIRLYALNHRGTLSPANIVVTQGVFGIPVSIEDWQLQTDLIGIAGSKPINSFVNAAYNDIALNEMGIAFITPGGMSKFCLREGAEVDQSPNTYYGTYNTILFHSPLLAGYEPKLVLNYELTTPPPPPPEEKQNIWPWVIGTLSILGIVLVASKDKEKRK